MDHDLSELSTMTCPSWVALLGMAHSFTELDEAVEKTLMVGKTEGRRRRKRQKETTENEMVGRHYQLNGHEFE